MRTIAFTLFGLLVLAYSVFSIVLLLRFSKYCERVARATGRIVEWQSIHSVDDGGFNAYQLEQWRALMNNEHRKLADQTLVAEGDLLSPRLRASRSYAIVLIVLVAILDVATR